MTRVQFPEPTPEERAAGDAFWARFERALALSRQHEADQVLAQLHASIANGTALGNQCVCGAPDCAFRAS